VLALAKRARGYDRVVVQYHPDVFLPLHVSPGRRLATNLALCVLFFLASRCEVRVHEVDYQAGRRPGLNALATLFMWRLPAEISVHTEAEAERFRGSFFLPALQVHVAEHGEHFEARTALDRRGARAKLGLDSGAVVFLSIGFIQPHKGFDRAVKVFGGLGERGCELHVVGSVRLDEPDYVDYADELEHLCRRTPGAFLHRGYLSDERFDDWLVAADVVVLPYRHIWSSSVIERAALFDRPVIASRVGGLEGQAPEGTRLVDDDMDLRSALVEAAAEHGAPVGLVGEVEWPTEVGREAIQAAIAVAAIEERGGPPLELETGRMPARPLEKGSDGLSRLRRIPPLNPPQPASARPGAAVMKRVVRRLTAWEIDPVVHQINRLRQATLDALEPPDDDDPEPNSEIRSTDPR
jgi:glycosyltransferase involved in cell wall biosynthesis